MAKLDNDKYFTPIDIANHCWDIVYQVCGDVFTDIIEPSIGNGSFLHHNTYKPNTGYDIDPQCSSTKLTTINKQDFLSLNIGYLKGRLIIGNPPYGRTLNLAQKFFKKSVDIGDYIAFILPISQLNNTHSMYEFDLLYSEDLGEHLYTDRKLHCCFNIYRRPTNGTLNKKPLSKLKDITIYRQDSKGYSDKQFDIRICYWGDGCCGKILNENEHYSAEYKIKINNQQLKENIIDVLSTFDWKSYLKCIAMKKIQQFHIIDVLCKNIDGIS